MPRPEPKPDRNIRGLLAWQASGFLFIVAAGSLFHFFYGWFGPSKLLAAVFPVNESVWEHLKLGYWSLVLFTTVQSLAMRWRAANLWGAAGIGIIILQGTILAVFHSYIPSTGHPVLTLDIGSYVLGALLCQAAGFWFMAKSRPSRPLNRLGVWILVLHGLALVIFTFAAPRLPLFMDGRTGAYGIPK
jgi:hypothetical protein